MFLGVDGFFQNLGTELETLKRRAEDQAKTRDEELTQLRGTLERHRRERKETNARLKYEFEEFVHRRIGKILEEVEELKSMEHSDDFEQQRMIEQISQGINELKGNLFFVQRSWGKMVAHCFNGGADQLDLADAALRTHELNLARRLSQSSFEVA